MRRLEAPPMNIGQDLEALSMPSGGLILFPSPCEASPGGYGIGVVGPRGAHTFLLRPKYEGAL